MILKSGKSLPLFVYKSASEEVVSSTTLQNDDDLVIALKKNKVYKIDLFCSSRSSGSDIPNIKIQWTLGGTLTNIHGTCFNNGPGSTSSTAEQAENTQLRRTATNYSTVFGVLNTEAVSIRQTFFIDTGASGGTLQMQWAQNTSNANGTDVEAGSFLIATEIKGA